MTQLRWVYSSSASLIPPLLQPSVTYTEKNELNQNYNYFNTK